MSLVSAILLGLGLGNSPVIYENIQTPPRQQQARHATAKTKAIKRTRSPKPTQHFLLPVTKQTFKQNRRKELKASARKKNKG